MTLCLPLFSRATICGFFLSLATLQFSTANEPYILFENTASPDGRYCLGWGIKNSQIDTTSTDTVLAALDSGPVENYLIDVSSKQIISTIGSDHFAFKDLHANRGSLKACWRGDSKAVLIEESARFGSELVVVIHIVEPDHPYETCSDVTPINRAMTRAARAQILSQHPAEKETVQFFAITFVPIEWTSDDRVTARVIGEIPKDEDAFIFDGTMSFPIPSPSMTAEAVE